MKNFINIIFIFSVIFSCKNYNDNENISKNIEVPKIIDTSNFKSINRNSNWLETVEYNILYIGDKMDTIYPDYNINFYPVPPDPPAFPNEKNKDSIYNKFKTLNEDLKINPYNLVYFENKQYKWYNESKIKIIVDTLQNLKKEDIFSNNNYTFFNAYPIIIKSKESDTIKIGIGNNLPIVLEAKDSIGKWKPIEEEFKYMCGTGLNTIILPPKTIILSSVMIYKGNYKTKLRIKLGENYSNEFYGTINYRQFESIFDSNGQFKKEYLKESK